METWQAPSAASSEPNMRKAGEANCSRIDAEPQTVSENSKLSEKMEMERLRKMHEEEIEVRADEKLAAVRNRDKVEEREREQKYSARAPAERKVDQWTRKRSRNGNLRPLFDSLNTELYNDTSWRVVSMDVLKNPKV